MASSTVKDTDKGYKSLKEFLANAGKVYVVVGVRGEKGAKRYDKAPGEKGEPLSLVEVAAVHEFGSEDGRVPERSFLRSTFDTHRPKYERVLRKGVDRCISGVTSGSGAKAVSTIEHELDRLGVRVAGDVTLLIKSGEGIQPKLADATIARKGSTHTLIDTGRLSTSIDSEVRRDE